MSRFSFDPLLNAKKWLNNLAGRAPRKASKKAPANRPFRRRAHLVLDELECRVTPSATLVASSYFDSAVYEFDSGTGALKATLVAPNSSALLIGPAGLAVGPDGNLYISSQINPDSSHPTNSIVEYNLTTNALSTFISAAQLQSVAAANSDPLFAPAGLQFGPDGNLYICLNGGQSSVSGGAVVRFNIAAGAGGLTYTGTSTTIATGLIQPSALTFGTVSPDTNNLYVSNSGMDDVVTVTNATSATPISSTFIAPGSGGMNFPAGLTWGPDGELYVTDLGATSFQGNVLQFNPNGSFNKVITPTGSGQPGNLQFQFPSDVLFDGQGHLLTANLGSSQTSPLTGSINQYNTDGTFDQTLVSSSQFPNTGPGTSGIAPSQFVLLPSSAPASSAPRPVLVTTSYFDSAVYLFDSVTGDLEATLVAPNSSSLLIGPAGITYGPDGNLYISSQINPDSSNPTNSILEYNVTSGTLSTFISTAALQSAAAANSDALFAPAGLEFGPDGNLYVCLTGGQSSFSGGAVVRFNITSAGGNLAYGGTFTTVATGLIQPSGLTFGAAGDPTSLYVSNSLVDDVVKIAHATTATPASSIFIAPGSGGMNFPAGLTWGPDEKFYVTDLGATSFQGNILQFNSNGSFSQIVTPTGSGQPGNLLFQFPSDVLFDGQGHLLTANLGSSKSSNLAGSINQYNNNGTFDQTVVSSSQFPNTGSMASGIAPSQFLLVPAPATVTHFAISAQSSNSITAGGTVSFTLSAEDSNNNAVPGYTGTVQLTSTDAGAVYAGSGLPATYTFNALDAGVHTFTVTLTTAASQTITAADQQNSSLTATTTPVSVAAGAFSKFVVNVLGGNNVIAGNSFIFTTQASDQYGNTVQTYNGPTSITTTLSQADPLGNFPVTGSLNSNGFGFFLGSLKTAGTYTLIATAGAFSGSSAAVTVSPTSAEYFTVAAPAGATTGVAFNLTVTAYDKFGNTATGYTGTVKLASTDAAAALGTNYTFTTGAGKDNGTHTFSVALNSSGTQTITALDAGATNPTIQGVSGAITTRGLLVTSFTATATGFTATFDKPFVPADLTLYGSNLNAIDDITMFGSNSVGAIHGTLFIDPSNQSITFKATATYLGLLNTVHGGIDSVVLPDATYTVKLLSGSGTNGFLDALGAGLDGAGNGGHANFTTTFATHYQSNATPVLGIPDFARGPDSSTPIAVPTLNFGIPLTLYDAPGVTDVTFSLTYNTSLLNLTGTLSGANSDATDPAATLSLVSNTAGVATFHYFDANPKSATPAGPLVLGDLTAIVPSSSSAAALGLYQVKEQLQLSRIVINQGSIAGAVSANGVHVNAYFGDVNGDKVIDGLDKLAADAVAQGRATGFSAFTQLDPAIVGDVAGDDSIDAGDVSTIDAYVAELQPTQIPVPPTQLPTTNTNYVNPNLIHSPNAADPTLSLADGGALTTSAPSEMVVSVRLDQPHPEGSTGLTEASLALTYDPSLLTVAPGDIALGSLSSLGSGWRLSSVVDATTGQIGILLYSPQPITTLQAGSLVNITFHILPAEQRGLNSAMAPFAGVQLVASATPAGQRFDTTLADAQGGLILSPGADRLTLPTEVSAATPSDLVSLNTKAAWPGLRHSEAPDSDTADAAGASEYLSPGHPGVIFDVTPLAALSNGAAAGEAVIVRILPTNANATAPLSFQPYLPTNIVSRDWLTLANQPPTDGTQIEPYTGVMEDQDTDQQIQSDPVAVLDKLFADMANDVDQA